MYIRTHEFVRWIPISIAMGILGGFGAIIFHEMTALSTSGFSHVHFLISLVLGGLASGIVVYTFAPEAAGHGTDAAIAAVHAHCGRVRNRVAAVKTLASAFTIGSGGSAGEEGPSVQIGGGLASTLGRRLKLSGDDLRVLSIAGMGATLAGIFKSPIGGAIFAAEVMYKRDMEYAAVIPAIISGVIGGTLFMLFHGTEPILDVSAHTYSMKEAIGNNVMDLPAFIVLALLVGLICRVFIHFFYFTERIFRELQVPRGLKPALGALIFGLLVVIFSIPGTMGVGYETIQEIIDRGTVPFSLLLLLLLGKIVGTSLVVASGGSGGVVAPSLFMGAMAGGAIGKVLSALPYTSPDITVFMLVGMSAALAATSKTPLAGIILVYEFSGLNTPIPLAVGSLVGYLASGTHTIHINQRDYNIHKPCKEVGDV
jgi:CIC family chloride channel protein